MFFYITLPKLHGENGLFRTTIVYELQGGGYNEFKGYLFAQRTAISWSMCQ
jgi:hypothetical protein